MSFPRERVVDAMTWEVQQGHVVELLRANLAEEEAD